tara:strand:- start:16586 stop:17251 length:666 start_codon:yes stop_codon:yes gene_type:complete
MSNIRISELTAVTDLTLDGVFPLSQPDIINDNVITTYKTTLQQVFDLFSALFPVGLILPYGGIITPTILETTLKGWVVCDGTSLVISNYNALYEAIGDTYGISTNTNNFKLPDLRGRSLIGAGQGAGLVGNYQFGISDGQEYVALHQSEIPFHTHQYENFNNDHEVESGKGTKARGSIRTQWTGAATTANPVGDGLHGSRQVGNGHPNMQPYTVINYIIKT